MLGNPSKNDFQGMVSNNLITNCPVMHNDITNARTIFGPDLVTIQGKTVRQAPAPVVGDYVAVPWQLVEANAAVMLEVDVFFVKGMAFLVTISRRIKFITTEHVPVRIAKSLSKHICWVRRRYCLGEITKLGERGANYTKLE
jgi:hypothetical protein